MGHEDGTTVGILDGTVVGLDGTSVGVVVGDMVGGIVVGCVTIQRVTSVINNHILYYIHYMQSQTSINRYENPTPFLATAVLEKRPIRDLSTVGNT